MSGLLIEGRARDLGGFMVARSLPSTQRRSVGPFVFLDHMGPLKVNAEHLLSVRPHPHIGLATVTYLFDGRIHHRDSLESSQVITPGALNWMTAGRGIVHSERTPSEDVEQGVMLEGIQIWVALPKEKEECAPSFVHWPKEKLPELKLSEGLEAKVLLGSFAGKASPVETFSPTLFVDLNSVGKTETTLDIGAKEFGLFVARGEAEVDGQLLRKDDLLVFEDVSTVKFKTLGAARVILIGGEPHPEKRTIWWNFVSSSPERIREAAKMWTDQKMGTVPGEVDFIPLPKDPLP